MKVYLDELPERCLDCCLLSDGNFCNHDDFVGELHSVNVYKEKPKNCPLKLLADHDKQVRKEVCQEIRDKITHWEDCLTKEVTEYVIDKETLDKIEQGE